MKNILLVVRIEDRTAQRFNAQNSQSSLSSLGSESIQDDGVICGRHAWGF